MSTDTRPEAAKPNAGDCADSNLEPVISFTRIIQIAPNSGSFSGWGPKVTGLGSIRSNWN
ncbi:MAG: hypothetical protein M3Y21_01995 [Candidatus Eremiobacteraeota bacterium]|nr:hypothetical protein [Candidatus Eremiobacteraeota bacterium]